MKELLFLIPLFFLFQVALAQNNVSPLPLKGNGRIHGVAMDSTSKTPVEFANVALYDPTSGKPVDGTVCDDKGRFNITKLAKGNYWVVISFIGFETKRISVALTDKKNEIDLGTITIRSSAKELEAIVVEGQKVLVEEKVDRMVYNAENDLTTKGGDATDVLKRVPLLSVDMDGNVTLRGSSSVKVLINNKPSTITASSVADALKQIPADMIKNVEVITSPSSKYDAEGSAGIINIVLKKNTLEGVFLNVDGSMGTRGSNLSLNGAYRKGKMGFTLGAFNRAVYNVNGNFTNNQTTYSNGDTILNIQSANTHSNGTNSQYTFGWDYDINKLNSLTASVRYGQQDQSSYQDQLYTQNFQHDSLQFSNLKNVKNTMVSTNIDASLNYTRMFAKKDREFNFMAILSRNNPTAGFTTNTISTIDNSTLSSYRNENKGHTQEVTLQADFQEPIAPNQLIEFGAKDVIRNVTSDYQYMSAGSNGEYQPVSNPLLSNNFNYQQSVTAGYASYTLTTESNITLKAGGRYEYTLIDAHFTGQPSINIPSYGVLVPSVNISRKLKNGNLLKASYNRRIQRPNLQNLNPNLVASNPLNVTIGNPNLKPEYADNYEIAYKTFYKSASINFSSYVRYNTNDIQQARSVRHDTIVATFQNIGTEANYGASIFTSIPFSNHFSINGGIDYYYRILKNNSPDPALNATNQGLVQNYRLSGNYNFKNGWAVQFFGVYQGRNFNLQGYRTNPINHSLAVKKDILDKKGMLGIGLDNFLTPSYQVHSQLNSAYLAQYTTNTLYNFIVKVNFSYRIGRLSTDKKPKKSLEDEEN